jgi:hypothetical protein
MPVVLSTLAALFPTMEPAIGYGRTRGELKTTASTVTRPAVEIANESDTSLPSLSQLRQRINMFRMCCRSRYQKQISEAEKWADQASKET